uniref:Uncharacterized protein n=1 Tax=Triticum urartu TaxID=4572 RepID=A0A8R7QFJ5_TRIUA
MGATMPFSVVALMCKSQLQQPTRCLPGRSILVIGLYVTHSFYMASTSAQVDPQEGRDVKDGTAFLYQDPHGSDYYLNHAHSFELVQIHLNYGYDHDNYHGDHNMIKNLQAPWDPGELLMTTAWGQAAFQEGRDVRDPLGLPVGGTWANPTRVPTTNTGEAGHEEVSA